MTDFLFHRPKKIFGLDERDHRVICEVCSLDLGPVYYVDWEFQRAVYLISRDSCDANLLTLWEVFNE